MVEHNQTIRRLSAVAEELFEYVWAFCGVDVQSVKVYDSNFYSQVLQDTAFLLVGAADVSSASVVTESEAIYLSVTIMEK